MQTWRMGVSFFQLKVERETVFDWCKKGRGVESQGTITNFAPESFFFERNAFNEEPPRIALQLESDSRMVQAEDAKRVGTSGHSERGITRCPSRKVYTPTQTEVYE